MLRYVRLITLLLLMPFAPAGYVYAEFEPETSDVVLDEYQLQRLVAPIALYPDELLAIVLPAATYPLQIVEASRYREDSMVNDQLLPEEYWDEAVVALLNYPEALSLLNEDLQWTWSLGQAVLNQQAEVMHAISEFRQIALGKGNLRSDRYQHVQRRRDAVTISTRDPQVIYIPYYVPADVVIYQRRPVYHYYPTAYPVYYHPYRASHRFYGQQFWGVRSAFSLAWQQGHITWFGHQHRRHPYYGHRYSNRHFHRTFHFQQRASARFRHQRYANQRWQPNFAHVGMRPNRARIREHRRAHGLQARRHKPAQRRDHYRDANVVQPPPNRVSRSAAHRVFPHQPPLGARPQIKQSTRSSRFVSPQRRSTSQAQRGATKASSANSSAKRAAAAPKKANSWQHRTRTQRAGTPSRTRQQQRYH